MSGAATSSKPSSRRNGVGTKPRSFLETSWLNCFRCYRLRRWGEQKEDTDELLASPLPHGGELLRLFFCALVEGCDVGANLGESIRRQGRLEFPSETKPTLGCAVCLLRGIVLMELMR